MKVEIHTMQVGQTWRDDYNNNMSIKINPAFCIKSRTLIILVT